ncbi:MAG: hypothetical protein FWE90_11980 [Defluviitaleaceae bacterium]|nr:hypothetical protein [Defluviitaleaceae bacterium]
MNVENKLDYFAAVIINEAEATQKRKARERSARIEAAVSLALAEAKTRINERIREKTHEIKKTRYMKIAAAIADERMGLNGKRQSLLDVLRGEVEERLRMFVTSDAYAGYMEEAIGNAVKSDNTARGRSTAFTRGGAVIQLMRRDMGLVMPPGLAAEASDADFIGGFILYNAKRTKRVDLSFKALITKGIESFHENIE